MDCTSCQWTLDLSIRCLLSIREARLITRRSLNVLVGPSGCGKSQLLLLIHNTFNSIGTKLLQDLGYRTLFRREAASFQITGPKAVYHISPTRVLGKDIEERRAGAYTFTQLKQRPNIAERYRKFRLLLSRLAFEAELDGQAEVRESRAWILKRLQSAFAELFPGRSLYVSVNTEREEVTVHVKQVGMDFMRPDDPSWRDLLVPFGTLSDGEVNVLFLLYEVLSHSSGSTPTLILIDELENHLHPELQSSFTRVLYESIPPHVMVLATTHSPQILGAAPADSRILMVHSTARDERGRLFPNQLLTVDSRVPVSRMLFDMYGAGSAALAASLLSETQRISTAEVVPYAYQCLFEPSAKSATRPSDPQRAWLSGYMHALSQEKELHILDIGAGSGREVGSLRQDLASDPMRAVVFDLVEPNRERQKLLREMSASAHMVSIRAIYDSIDCVPDDASYDMIFAHNVIHELPTRDFLTLLSHYCRQSQDSMLSILEQAVLPTGETGYFLFHLQAMVRLLKEIGFSVLSGERTSYSGIPLYEVTAHGGTTRPTARALQKALSSAIERTVRLNLQRYREVTENRRDPIEMAFLAFNIANGKVRLSELGIIDA